MPLDRPAGDRRAAAERRCPTPRSRPPSSRTSRSVNGAPDLPAEHGLAGFQRPVKDTLGDVSTDVYGDPLCGTGICLSYCYVVDNGVDIGIVDPIDAAGRCPTDPTGLATMTDGPGARLRRSASAGNYTNPCRDGGDRGQGQDPEPRHEPLHALGHPARRVELDPDHHPRGQPRLGLVGHGRRDRPRHRVRRRRRAVPGDHLRLRASPPDTLSAGPAGHDQRRRRRVSRSTCPATAGCFGGRLAASPAPRSTSRSTNPWVALSDLEQRRHRGVDRSRRRQRRTSTSPTCPTATTRSRGGTSRRTTSSQVQNVTVTNGEVVDVGLLPLTGWWTQYSGYVFNDTNRNGMMDWTDTNHDGCPQAGEGETRRPQLRAHHAPAGELADGPRHHRRQHRRLRPLLHGERLPDDAVVGDGGVQRPLLHDRRHLSGRQPARRRRRCSAPASTSARCRSSACAARWTGVSTPTTPAGTNGVDPQNGGIVGTVSYDTTRNELDPRFAAVEDWQPGVSGLTVELYQPVDVHRPLDRDPCDDDRALPARRRRCRTCMGRTAQHLRDRDLGSSPGDATQRRRRSASPATSTATESPTRPTSRSPTSAHRLPRGAR